MRVVTSPAPTKDFPAHPSSARPVRRWLSGRLGEHPRRADAELLGAELFTNALQACEDDSVADALIRVRLTWPGGAPNIAVRNAHPGREGPRLKSPSATCADGRGLLIVTALATSSGAYRDETGRWWVWATLTERTPASEPGSEFEVVDRVVPAASAPMVPPPRRPGWPRGRREGW